MNLLHSISLVSQAGDIQGRNQAPNAKERVMNYIPKVGDFFTVTSEHDNSWRDEAFICVAADDSMVIGMFLLQPDHRSYGPHAFSHTKGSGFEWTYHPANMKMLSLLYKA